MSIFAADLPERLAAQWRQGPHVFRGAVLEPLFTTREFMTAVLGTAMEYAANPSTPAPPGRVFLGSAVVKPEQLGPFLPRGGGEAFDQYVARIRQAHPDEEVGMVLDTCEKYMPAVRAQLVPLLHGLFARVGYPARQNHACVYAGNYKTTPFGIHRDDCHVLMFSGVGKKQMAFWPLPYFQDKRELFVGGKLRAPVADYLADATVLEIGPSDILYWPPTHWHVAVSDTDEFRAALSVGLYHDGSSTERLAAFDFLATLRTVTRLDLAGLPGAPEGRVSGASLPATQMAPFFDEWNRLRDALNTPGEAEFRALQIVLRSVSSAGYGKAPASADSDGALETAILRCPIPEALVVAPARGGLMLGANGSVFLYHRETEAIERAVTLLRRGAPVPFDDLAGTASETARSVIAAVVHDAIRAGAVSLIPSRESVAARGRP